MSKLITETARLVLGLTRDAYGNLVSGQDERALHYLALQSELLHKFIGLLEDRNNYRKVAEVEKLCKDIATDQHEAWAAFPAWDGAAQAAHAERFGRFHEITQRVLPQMNPTAVLEQAREEAERTGATSIAVELSKEQLAELFTKH